MTDRHSTPITVFDGASYALEHINRMREKNIDIDAAVASRTDEPSWAQQCMDWLTITDGTTLTACFRYVEIDFSDKKDTLKDFIEKPEFRMNPWFSLTMK